MKPKEANVMASFYAAVEGGDIDIVRDVAPFVADPGAVHAHRCQEVKTLGRINPEWRVMKDYLLMPDGSIQYAAQDTEKGLWQIAQPGDSWIGVEAEEICFLQPFDQRVLCAYTYHRQWNILLGSLTLVTALPGPVQELVTDGKSIACVCTKSDGTAVVILIRADQIDQESILLNAIRLTDDMMSVHDRASCLTLSENSFGYYACDNGVWRHYWWRISDTHRESSELKGILLHAKVIGQHVYAVSQSENQWCIQSDNCPTMGHWQYEVRQHATVMDVGVYTHRKEEYAILLVRFDSGEWWELRPDGMSQLQCNGKVTDFWCQYTTKNTGHIPTLKTLHSGGGGFARASWGNWQSKKQWGKIHQLQVASSTSPFPYYVAGNYGNAWYVLHGDQEFGPYDLVFGLRREETSLVFGAIKDKKFQVVRLLHQIRRSHLRA
ncbi:hypothetical protein HY523_01825 [Candidatus Berkelbacteria bacterium]|nr:hypothetical protein [Candidatus Berkelbacteria bacterium]